MKRRGRKTIGESPLDAVVPKGPEEAAPMPQGDTAPEGKLRLTVYLP